MKNKVLKLTLAFVMTAITFTLFSKTAFADSWEVYPPVESGSEKLKAEMYGGVLKIRAVGDKETENFGNLSKYHLVNVPWESMDAQLKFKEVYFEPGITDLGDLTKLHLDHAKTYHFPVTLKNFGNNANQMLSVQTIYYGGTKEQWEALTKGAQFSFALRPPTVYYESDDFFMEPDGEWEVGAGKSSDVIMTLYGDTLYLSGRGTMKDFNLTGNDSERSPMAYVNGIKHVVIGDGVRNIGDYTFWGIGSLEDVSISESVTCIGANSFTKTGITEIRIPASVTEIRSDAFFSCPSLKTVYLPQNVGKIGEFAFFVEHPIDVFYAGSVKYWEEMNVDRANEDLYKGTITFNYNPVEQENRNTVMENPISANVFPGNFAKTEPAEEGEATETAETELREETKALQPSDIILLAAVAVLAAALVTVITVNARKKKKAE